MIERDSRFNHTVSAQYVSPEVVGYEDLDRYGIVAPRGEQIIHLAVSRFAREVLPAYER